MFNDTNVHAYIIRLIEEALDKISTIKQQEAGEKSRASRQQTQPPLSIEDIQTRCVCVFLCTHLCIHVCVCMLVLCVFVCVLACVCVSIYVHICT